jgi:NADPH-dependent 2,4-dienoyl-CoA reductase/sulfur reductase-like enzyme
MKQADVVIVGAGPAGIAAASTAAQHSRSVILLDDNPAAGGQVWRDGVQARGRIRDEESAARTQALQALESCGATLLFGYRVFDAGAPSTLYAVRETAGDDEVLALRYRHLILATGARERFLPFPGWTLPGVFGAGGLQALVKGGFPVHGKRIVVAGSGPLLLAVAAHLQEYGAEIVCIAEQAPLSRLAKFAFALRSHPAKIRQGVRYRHTLRKTPYRTGCWPVSVLADETTLRGIELTDGVKTWKQDCDLIACGFHLVPNTELASLLGCTLRDGFVQIDENQQTSISNIYCAGEPTGIAGLDAALLQGEIAGHSCAGHPDKTLRTRNRAEKIFAAQLQKAFQLRPELRLLAKPETIVCRCEDVPYRSLAMRSGWTDAKLQTRCGMGPCQGRICGPASEMLFGWKMKSIRPPLFPVSVNAFCLSSAQQDLTQENA